MQKFVQRSSGLSREEVENLFDKVLDVFRLRVVKVTTPDSEGREFLPGFGGLADSERSMRDRAVMFRHNDRFGDALDLLRETMGGFEGRIRNHCRFALVPELSKAGLAMSDRSSASYCDADLVDMCRVTFNVFRKHIDQNGNNFDIGIASRLYWDTIKMMDNARKTQQHRDEEAAKKAAVEFAARAKMAPAVKVEAPSATAEPAPEVAAGDDPWVFKGDNTKSASDRSDHADAEDFKTAKSGGANARSKSKSNKPNRGTGIRMTA